MKKFLSYCIKYWPFLFFLFFAIAIRIYFFSTMGPVVHTDSISYFFMQELDSVRTPGFPFFLEIIFSLNDIFSFTVDYFMLVCFVQIFLLGLLNSILVYKIADFLTSDILFSSFMGIIYNLNFFVVSFGFQILTETLTITLLLLILFLYLNLLQAEYKTAALTGVLLVFLIYTKPSFLLLGFVLPFVTIVGYLPLSKKKKFWKSCFPFIAVFLAVTCLGIGGWSLRNKIKYDYFGISSIMPFNLRWYTNSLIHKYKPVDNKKLDRLAAIYAKEYEKTGNSSATFYNFQKRVQQEMGLTDIEISKALLKINIQLIIDYPGEYFKQVPESVMSYYKQYSPFWASGNTKRFLKQDNLFSQALRFFFVFYKRLFTSSFFLFILVIAAPVFVFLFTFRNKTLFHGWLVLESVILYNCLVSVFSTNAGVNNLRYRAPVEPLILLFFYASLYYLGKWIKSKWIRSRNL